MTQSRDSTSAAATATSCFTAIAAIIRAHGWAGEEQLAQTRALVPAESDGDCPKLLRLFEDQRVLTAERTAVVNGLLQQQQLLPSFRLLKKLGAGGMGTVYLATRPPDEHQMALKVINARLAGDSDFLARFERETKALANLRHVNIASIIDSGTASGLHYLAIEYINGPSLGALLKEHKALPEGYVLRLARQLCEGLAFVNAKCGLVHRDIKPENILVHRDKPTNGEIFPDDDVAKLIDFGLVKTSNDDESLTQTGMTIGTPLYMSPEQVRGEKLDCRSDIYSLGCSMYHLLTGTAPFRGPSPGAIMSAHLTNAVPDPGDLVRSLEPETRRVVTTAMAKDPKQRFITFAALITALDHVIGEIARKSGGNTLRLLRKPLVINNTKRPPGKSAKEGSVSERIVAMSKDHKEPATPQYKAITHPIEKNAAGEQAPLETSRSSRRAEMKGLTNTIEKPKPQTGKIGHDSDSLRPSVAKTKSPKPAKGADDGSSSVHKPGTALITEGGDVIPEPGSVSDALVKIRSERLAKVPGSPTAAPPSQEQPSSNVALGLGKTKDPLLSSAAFNEEASRPRGFSLFPWLMLTLAIVAAIAYYMKMIPHT